MNGSPDRHLGPGPVHAGLLDLGDRLHARAADVAVHELLRGRARTRLAARGVAAGNVDLRQRRGTNPVR